MESSLSVVLNVKDAAADDSIRLSVLAARSGALVINIVLTTAASVRGNMDFILILSVVTLLVFDTGHTMMHAPNSDHGV
jgi:hypothetical protein